MLLNVARDIEPRTTEELLYFELARLAWLWMDNKQASLDKVLNRLGELNGSLVEVNEGGMHLHQCALEGLQTILHALCGLHRPPYNQVSVPFAAMSVEAIASNDHQLCWSVLACIHS